MFLSKTPPTQQKSRNVVRRQPHARPSSRMLMLLLGRDDQAALKYIQPGRGGGWIAGDREFKSLC